MNLLWLLPIFLIVAIWLQRYLLRGRAVERAAISPYVRKDFLLTRAERSFFGVLQSAISHEHYAVVKPRLADLFYIRKGTVEWQSHFNRIKAKHVDFVLCRNSDMRPLLAIELDDHSHQREDRRERDKFVDAVFANSGFPLLRVPVQRSYSVIQLKLAIEVKLQNRVTQAESQS